MAAVVGRARSCAVVRGRSCVVGHARSCVVVRGRACLYSFRFGHYVLFLVSIGAYCNFDKATPWQTGAVCVLVIYGPEWQFLTWLATSRGKSRSTVTSPPPRGQCSK